PTRRLLRNSVSPRRPPRCACTVPAANCGRSSCRVARSLERQPMLCEEVAELLPGLVDSDERNVGVEAHVESCLRCQAEVARYRKLLRAMALLRTRYL